jgi:hypothetical protein
LSNRELNLQFTQLPLLPERRLWKEMKKPVIGATKPFPGVPGRKDKPGRVGNAESPAKSLLQSLILTELGSNSVSSLCYLESRISSY